MTVTLADIANRLGVNPSTISLALNDATSGKLSPDRVKQVRELANRLGYRPNLSARQLRGGRTRCIGVVMNYSDYYPYSQYFYLISEYCSDRGYHAVPLPMKHSDGRPQEHLELVENAAVDAMIVLEYDPTTESHFRRRTEQGCPVIFRVSDPQTHSISAHHNVQIDYPSAVCELIKQIIGRGWERFYFLVERNAKRPNPFVDEHGFMSYEAIGIAEAARETGIDIFRPDRIISSDGRWAKSRYEAVSAFLETHTLEPGTCLLHCGSDGSSGTYAALANAGLRIGVDVAVAATNSTPAWEYVLPLTTCCIELIESTSRWLVDAALDLVESKPPRRIDFCSQVSPYRIKLTDSTLQR